MSLDAIATERFGGALLGEGRAAEQSSLGYPCQMMGGLPIVLHRRDEAARFIERAGSHRAGRGQVPLFITSANGEVMARVARDPAVRALFEAADMIHADGQAMVLASRLRDARPLPERVATTDLFHDVAALAEQTGTSFYLLGGTPEVNAATVAAVRARYPRLVIAGARHGYMTAPEEAGVVAEIARLQPGVLWVAMGVPLEQAFVTRHRAALAGVGVVKTAGGLFDFLSGRRSRAPMWMQRASLEWLYRAWLEPARLGPRYLLTNPQALRIMLARPEARPSGFQAGQAAAFGP